MNQKRPPDLSPRSRSALALLIADLFLRYPDLQGTDKALSVEGVRLAWGWVEGKQVDPSQICEYIDGEINLPVRSTRYARDTRQRDTLVASFHAIGFVGLYACEQAHIAPPQGIENFGENEWQRLYGRIERLDPRDAERAYAVEKSLLLSARVADDATGFGPHVSREDVWNAAALS